MEFVSLKKALDLTPEEVSRLSGYDEKIKDIAEFFSDAQEAFGELSFVEALQKATPWFEKITDSAGDALPIIKFAASFLGKLLKEKDPEILGRLACTLAYQRAAQQSSRTIGQPNTGKQASRNLKDFAPSSDVDFKTITLMNALSHRFVKEADRALLYYAERVGFSEAQRTKWQTGTHSFFIENLTSLLSNRETAEKFEPFRQMISMTANAPNPYTELNNHSDYQRRLFDEARVFNTEPFALKDVYVENDCSHLTWGEISREGNRKDPFSVGLPRVPLLKTVLDLIGDPKLDDAIVIQGAAGAGKSSFTLKLFRELLDRGLRPIRVRLRDVRLDTNIREALPQAMLLHDPDADLSIRGYFSPDDVFLGGNIFRERIFYNGFTLCPCILILDGWDEISLSAPEGFRKQVTRMLNEIREEFLRNRETKVRVVITGRPSIDVSESHFLLQNTPVLTVRTLTPDQLDQLVGRFIQAGEETPLGGNATLFLNKEGLREVLREYREQLESGSGGSGTSGSMEILGLPLLAHLALRLIACTDQPVGSLLKKPTDLFRSLIDMTVERKGRFGEGSDVVISSTGRDEDLRRKLQMTAAAITAFGKESIPSRELAIRLGLRPRDLETWAQDATKNHFLTELLVNFFFKGGNEKLGCEFLHKSFREYLFAEHVVNILKQFGFTQSCSWQERPDSEYWMDFFEGSNLWKLSRALSEALSPQRISGEVSDHLSALLDWEIGRAVTEPFSEQGDVLTLSIRQWEYVRDALADIWDWWGEGVHLRVPLGEDKRHVPEFGRAYVTDLVELAAPRDVDAQRNGMLTIRTTTIDAHLGEGLFRLSMLVHSQVARRLGWDEDADPALLWQNASPVGSGPRRYQTSVRREREWILFAPSGKNSQFFRYYQARINASGWKFFPAGSMVGLDLRHVVVSATEDFMKLRHCNISNATFYIFVGFFNDVFAESTRFVLTRERPL